MLWREVFKGIMTFCPITGVLMEARRATDQSLLKKLLVLSAVPVLTAAAVALVSYGAFTQWQSSVDERLALHEKVSSEERESLGKRIEALEHEMRITHNKIVDYMLYHAEQDRREFKDLRDR